MKYRNKQFYKFCLVMAGVCCLSSAQLLAQTGVSIEVNRDNNYNSSTMTPEELVKQVFITNGAAASVSNVTVTNVDWNGTKWGDKRGLAYFSSTNATNLFPITKGLLLGTGDVTFAEGPNSSNKVDDLDGRSTSSSDEDAQSLINETIHDVVILKFNFIPNATSMQFKYAFASEEYPSYVNQHYNDVFGFFVTDKTANIKHGNIALLPAGASTNNGNYVGINTVNNGRYVNFEYNENDSYYGNRNATNSSYFIASKKNNKITEYNGYTKEMTAAIKNLIPCHTYELKLVVANVQDHFVGSGVFLKAGSFVLEDNAELHLFVGNEETSGIFKGCDNSVIRFTRPDSESANAQTFNLEYTGTANYDTDYTKSDGSKLPSTITFPAGQKSVDMQIKATDAAVAGSQFTASIYYTSPECTSTEASSILTVTIHDRTAIDKVDVEYPCQGNANGKITVTASGGLSAKEYSKDKGAHWQTSNVFNNLSAGTYEVAVRSHLECDSVAQTIVLNTFASDAGPDIEQCDPIFTMAGSPTTGTWSVVGSAVGVQIADPSKYNTTVTLDFSQTQTATLRWTTSNGTCSESDEVVLKYKPCVYYIPVNPKSFFYKKSINK